jgi:hypothetical protein
MDIIRPITLTDSKLAYSSIAEDDHAEWNSETSYSVGDQCIVLDTHRIYTCEVESTDDYPPDNIYDGQSDPVSGFWSDSGATNRWAMFDNRSRAVINRKRRYLGNYHSWRTIQRNCPAECNC